MSLKKLISNYSSYNEWANNKIVRWLKTIDEELLTQKTKSSFESIELTLIHITIAQEFWFEFISNGNPNNFDWDDNKYCSNSILFALPELSKVMKNKFMKYNEEDLLEKLELNQTWLKNSLCRYEYVVHVINHSTYHRGQIVTISRNMGIVENIPNTDYNIFNSVG